MRIESLKSGGWEKMEILWRGFLQWPKNDDLMWMMILLWDMIFQKKIEVILIIGDRTLSESSPFV